MVSLLCGCANFGTTQIDRSYEKGQLVREITTKVTASTFGTSKSELAKFKASQTDKTQGASVGNLGMETSGTNAVRVLQEIGEIVKALPK